MGVVKIKDIDFGYAKAIRELKKIRLEPFVEIGFQGQASQTIHPESDGPNGPTITEVATFNEFGTRSSLGNVHVPERSFMRKTMDENEKELIQITKKLLFKIGKGEMSAKTSLNILGLKIKALIQKKITDIRTPPNAHATIERKGSSNPLIDSGQMRQAVTHEVKQIGVLHK